MNKLKKPTNRVKNKSIKMKIPVYKSIVILFSFFNLLSIFANAQKQKGIEVLTFDAQEIKAREDTAYIFFKKNQLITKRKIEQGESIVLSPSGKFIMVNKSTYLFAPSIVSIYNEMGIVVKKIDDKDFCISCGLLISDDGRFVRIDNEAKDWESFQRRVSLFDHNGRLIKIYSKLFYSDWVGTFLADGYFVFVSNTSIEATSKKELIIFDEKFNLSCLYTFDSLIFRLPISSFFPISTDSAGNIELLNYEIIYRQLPEKNFSHKYTYTFDRKGNYIG